MSGPDPDVKDEESSNTPQVGGKLVINHTRINKCLIPEGGVSTTRVRSTLSLTSVSSSPTNP